MSDDLVLYVPRHLDQRTTRPVERRDPKAATRQLQYHAPHLAQVPTWDPERAFRFGYIANVVAYRIVQLRANAIANVPLVVGPRRGQKRTDPENSPLYQLLGPPPGGPAPKLSARRLIRWTIAQEIVTGRRAWEIETDNGREDGRPVAFWPLVSAYLDAVESQGGTEWFRLFRYGPSQQKRTLPPGLVFYGWDPDGLDFRQAESAFKAARFDLSLVQLADRYGLSFLQNNATPATVVTTEAFPDDTYRQRFRQQWVAEVGGVDNAGRVVFNEVGRDGNGPVGESIDVKVLGLSQRDAQLIEQRREALMEIAIALGTPWSKLDASGRTYDNAEVEDRSWWEDTLEPDMSDLEDDINQQLAPRLGGDVCWFDRSQVRALQRKIQPVTQTVGVPSLVQAQLMTINEARADYGLPPLPNGDRVMTVDEIAALKQAGGGDEGLRSLLVAVESRAGGAEVTPGGNGDPAPAAEDAPAVGPPRPDPAPEDRGVDPEEVEARRARIWRATDAIVSTLESRWERAFRRLFTRQQTSTLERLAGKRGRQALGYRADGTRDPAGDIDPARIFDPTYWTDETRTLAADLYEQVVADSLSRVGERFEISFDLAAEWVDEMIAARSNQLAGQVTDTTYQAIQQTLVEGVAEGESIDDLAARIRAVFSDATGNRATVIARTEVISAYNGAAVTGAATLPQDVVAAQEWIATRDGRTRPAHAAADGQIVPVGQPFTVGADTLAYPGDPSGRASNTVQCRCTVAFLTPDELPDTGRTRTVDVRTARAVLDLVTPNTDLLHVRRALEVAAA